MIYNSFQDSFKEMTLIDYGIFKKSHYEKPEFALIRWCDYSHKQWLSLSIVRYKDCLNT